MEISDMVVQDKDGVRVEWNWWRFPGTDIEGAGLLKVTDEAWCPSGSPTTWLHETCRRRCYKITEIPYTCLPEQRHGGVLIFKF